MNWVAYAILVTLIFSIGSFAAYAQNQEQYDVKDPQSGQSYPVKYSIEGGTISDISINPQDSSLVISLQTTSDGNLDMTLPRVLIDAKSGADDDQFFVLVDGADTDFNETKTNTDRTISASFPNGTQQIEIIGTQVVPEFGPFPFFVLVVAILSIFAISRKTKLYYTK